MSIIQDSPDPAAQEEPIKLCKITTCRRTTEALQCQFFDEKTCGNLMHKQCSIDFVTFLGVADRPPDDTILCSKRCYNKWLKAKEKASKSDAKKIVSWEADGSMKALLEWITTEENYTKYSGGDGNNGTAKTKFHKEIAEFINERNDGKTVRIAKDVSNKIHKLESQFRTMVDWKNQTGAGLDDPGQVTSYIKSKCKYFYELEAVMGDRPNAEPLSTNEPNSDADDEDDEDEATGGFEGDHNNSDSDMEESVDNNSVATNSGAAAMRNVNVDGAAVAPGTTSVIKKKRLNLTGSTKPSKKQPKAKKGASDNLDGYIKEMMNDPNTVAKKGKEVELLDIQIQREKQQSMFDLLKQRKELEDMGVSQDDIDSLLPKPKYS